MFKNRLCAMPASSFVLNVPRLNLTPLIVVFALYFSPFLYTPIKPVVGLGFPCNFWVVEKEEDGDDDGLECRLFFFFVAALVSTFFVAFKDDPLYIFGANVGTNVLFSMAWQMSRHVLYM